MLHKNMKTSSEGFVCVAKTWSYVHPKNFQKHITVALGDMFLYSVPQTLLCCCKYSNMYSYAGDNTLCLCPVFHIFIHLFRKYSETSHSLICLFSAPPGLFMHAESCVSTGVQRRPVLVTLSPVFLCTG